LGSRIVQNDYIWEEKEYDRQKTKALDRKIIGKKGKENHLAVKKKH
jgi:hypothetical protein